jgi:hypothetical protein
MRAADKMEGLRKRRRHDSETVIREGRGSLAECTAGKRSDFSLSLNYLPMCD